MSLDFDCFITGIDHVQVAIPPGSENACRAFYACVLGMAEIDKPPVLASRGGLWLVAGDRQLHLGVEKDFRPAAKAHPAFTVWDAFRLAHRLAEAGHDVTWAREIPGVTRFHVHDPVGNRLEFVHAPRSFVETLVAGPVLEDFDIERSKDTGRDVDLD